MPIQNKNGNPAKGDVPKPEEIDQSSIKEALIEAKNGLRELNKNYFSFVKEGESEKADDLLKNL